jgi:methylthioribose-1-phosphate isomerase
MAIPRSVYFDSGKLRILDQTLLPGREVYLECTSVGQVVQAISDLSVRGAPAIGIAAAYALVLGLERFTADAAALQQEMRNRAARLKATRPTAVNLCWAVDRVMLEAERFYGQNRHTTATDGSAYTAGLAKALLKAADLIFAEDKRACRLIGEYGSHLIEQNPQVLTHCNAGSLAVSELGTALAPIYLAHQQGVPVHVYVDETRPLLQGSRLTAFELRRQGVNCTLISDNMAAHVMSLGKVDLVIVGADRVAANGDTANKIGTLNLAILCDHFNIPFYVACPCSTIDLDTQSGSQIEIEERAPEELRQVLGRPSAPVDVPVFNPAFDVTPAALITGLITEKGIIERPDADNLRVFDTSGD